MRLTTGGSLALLAARMPLMAGPSPERPVQAGDADLAESYAKYLRETKGIHDIITVHRSGEGPNYLDVVVVSAGFTADQGSEFKRVCEGFAKVLLSRQPWQRYRDLVNVHGVFVADESVDSTKVKAGGYKGNVLGCDNGIAVEYSRYAANSAATVVIHNSVFSTAGTGVWGVVVLNKGDVSPMAAIHELGHGLAGLGDEYIQRSDPFKDDPESLRDTVNVTATPEPKLCKWHYWTEDEWPGLFDRLKRRQGANVANFEGAGWPKGIYRPENTCMMRCDCETFCVVCNETMEASFYRYIDLFKVAEPVAEDMLLWKDESLDFRLTAIDFIRKPPAWIKSRLNLYLDGKQIASTDSGEVSYQLRSAAAGPGIHQLGANLNVQSEAVRRDFGFLSRSRCWRVKVIPYRKPTLTLPPLVTVAMSADGTVDVPVGIKHDERPDLFELKMTHAPKGAVLENGHFKWRPGGVAGSWRVDFAVVHEQRDVITASMEIHVKQPQGADSSIEVQVPDAVDAVTGKQVKAQLKASAKDGGHLLFVPVEVMSGVELDRETGDLSWTPRMQQAGPRRMRFRINNGAASREVDVVFRVRRDATPSPVSYCNSYIPQTLEALKQLQQDPLIYRRLFETLRLLRDRYARIHQPALAEAQRMYQDLSPDLRNNCLSELYLHAWAFSDKPEVLKWIRSIANGAKPDQAAILIAKLDQIDKYNVNRPRAAAEENRRRAAEQVDVLGGMILSWQMSRMYSEPGKSCNDLVASVFPPETGAAPDAAWIPVKAAADGIVNIRQALEKANIKGPYENCVVYLRATLDVPGATDARLELGSDDGVKAWVNAKEVFANPVIRPVKPGQDKVKVHLNKGSNTLLVKVTQGGQDWNACARIRALDGSVLPKIKFGLPG